MPARLKYLLYLLFIIVVIMATFFIWQIINKLNTVTEEGVVNENIIEDTEVIVEIKPNNTYGVLMAEQGVASTVANAIFEAASMVYDLSKVRVGRELVLIYDAKTNELKQFRYQIDTEEELFVTKVLTPQPPLSGGQESGQDNSSDKRDIGDLVFEEEISEINEWQAERKNIPYEVRVKTSEGTIESSLYESAIAQGVDERAVVELANIFQWSIDFAYQVQAGDAYKFIYEERFLDGEYIMPGRILAGKFINEDKPYYAFYFDSTPLNPPLSGGQESGQDSLPNKGEAGGLADNGKNEAAYYDENGNSVQKIFLKAPVAYKYISSGFTTGLRYIQAFNISTGHRAIDYAATYGTPIRSVGDGTVVYAGWKGSYGNFVSVRHNSTYTTNYAHMSKIAVKYGQQVKQNETIGYVGSTGLSTGPHVHYEMVKNGVKINPLREILPPGEPIVEENMARFNQEIGEYKKQLD